MEIVDEVSPVGSAGGDRNRRTINETVHVGSLDARQDRDPDVEHDTITIGRRGAGRVLSASAQRILDNIDKHGTAEAPDADTAETASPPAAAGVTDAGAKASPAAAPPPAVAAAAPDAPNEHVERLTTHNRKLLAEIETLKAKPSRGAMTAREKALDEAERGYIENPMASIRQLVATAIGSDDPKSKEVDAELTGLYQDFTERELAVALNPADKAARESARTRRMLERDKRDRRAEAEAAQPRPAEPDPSADSVAIISGKLAAGNHADKFPLLMNLSKDFDGAAPAELLWKVISHDIGSGELDPKTADEDLIAHASNKIETHYQALADKIGKARPSPSTAAQTQASPATESKAEPPGNGPRTITNASASVAPATPPAKKPETPTEAPPKYRNEAERRKALALKHFGA